MKVEYTGRQIEVSPAIQEFTEEHLKKIRKILGEMIEVHVILTVEEAVQEVDTSNSEFIVFRNAESERVSVVYRRRDGNFGLIEP